MRAVKTLLLWLLQNDFKLTYGALCPLLKPSSTTNRRGGVSECLQKTQVSLSRIMSGKILKKEKAI